MSPLPRTYTAREIRELRRRAGLTREQFARALGVNLNTVYRWETDNPLYARTERPVGRRA